jgi:serine/threonine protein kinase
MSCDCHPGRARYVLTDFGFSRAIENNGFSSDRRGTDGYRAPELLEYRDFSKKTDIWAFGCVMMEVVSSGKCYAFETDTAAYQYSRGKGGVQLPQLMRENNSLLDPRLLGSFNTLLEKCFCIDPTNRPSVEEILDYLKKALQSIDKDEH